MAFKRSNFKSLVSTKKEYFGSAFRFSKKADFKVGSDAYIIPLGLETGYYETPCHRIQTHKIDGKLIGFNGASFATYVKCTGIDENGNHDQSMLCCALAKKEKERIPDKNDSAKRIVSFTTSRIHLPILILGNSLAEDSKSYPISKVSITKDLKSESGLKFSFLDMSANTFQQDIILAYGKKLKEDGELDYEMDEESEEFMEEVRQRLSRTIIKVHGVAKQGFSAPMKEYSFFPFDNKGIAAQSPSGEREAIISYKENNEIMAQVNEFLDLFDREVDGLVQSWNEKDLQEYYNSAIGVALNTPINTSSSEPEEVELIDESQEYEEDDEYGGYQGEKKPLISEEEYESSLEDPFAEEENEVPTPTKTTPAKLSAIEELDEIELDMDDDAFLND